MSKRLFRGSWQEAGSQSAPVQAPGCPPTRLASPAGHSLGAAVATLLAPWAALQWPSADVRCVTFGSPRVGNQAFTNVSSQSCCTLTSQQGGCFPALPSAAGPEELISCADSAHHHSDVSCLQAFAQLVGVERRMVHENDIVPSVPTFTGRREGSTSTC